MNKQEAKEQLEKLLEEVNKLKAIIEAPDKLEVNTIEDVFKVIDPKKGIDINGKVITLLSTYKGEQATAFPSGEFGKHLILYYQLKIVEYYIAQKFGKCNWNSRDARDKKYHIYLNHGQEILHSDYNSVIKRSCFHFVSKEAREEFVRIVTKEKLIEFFKYNCE